MKTKRLLRVLSLLGFLLLIAPFYDSCDGKYPFVKVRDADSVVEKSFHEKAYDAIVDENAFNAFEIASLSCFVIRESTFREIKSEIANAFNKKTWYNELGIVISFLFDFIILISFLIVIFSFTDRMKISNKLAFTNCILILITLFYVICLEESFEH